MIQAGDGAGFALEALAQFGAIGKMCWQNFDGDVAAQARVARAIDLTHSARPERRNDFVRS
jgi:hypothetical protein